MVLLSETSRSAVFNAARGVGAQHRCLWFRPGGVAGRAGTRPTGRLSQEHFGRFPFPPGPTAETAAADPAPTGSNEQAGSGKRRYSGSGLQRSALSEKMICGSTTDVVVDRLLPGVGSPVVLETSALDATGLTVSAPV